MYLKFLCENFSSSLLFLSHHSSSFMCSPSHFLLCTSISAASPTTLCVCVSDSVLAECALALVALTGPDNSRAASICQPLHLWAAPSTGELAALFVLSPSGDRPAAKGNLQVYRSQAMSSLSHTQAQIPGRQHKHTLQLSIYLSVCLAHFTYALDVAAILYVSVIFEKQPEVFFHKCCSGLRTL